MKGGWLDQKFNALQGEYFFYVPHDYEQRNLTTIFNDQLLYPFDTYLKWLTYWYVICNLKIVFLGNYKSQYN